MARTSQRNTGWGTRAKDSRRPTSKRQVRLPASPKKRRFAFRDLRAKILRALGILCLCVLVAGVGFAAGGYLGLVKSVERLGEPRNLETHPTYMYSAPLGGNEDSRRVIGTIFQGVNHKTASLAEMPPGLLNALVAKEDERFREHGGVDLWGIMRALWVDIKAGKTVEGASTITQQYVKNAYLTQEQTWTRKIKEALIAIEIERKNDDKDQILADYLNTVYFGSNAYGVEAAAETYFNESVQDLTVAESATLVGLLWSPSILGEDREQAKYQRDLVLEKMADTGYISQEDSIAAREEPLPERWPMAPMVDSGLTGPPTTRDFAELVEEDLIERYGANTVLRGGLSVYTTLDLEAQVAARDTLYGPEGYLPAADDPDLALVSIEPETGRIKAMVGNRDPKAQFNLVTQARRQPGSSFKPFALIAALQQGIDPETEFISEKKEYQVDVGTDKPEKWVVKNYDGIERGKISLEEALWWSDNTVFTDLVMNAGDKGLDDGPEAVAEVAKKLGISADLPKHPNPSIVLGAYEVSPLDMATAYATIANGGRRVEPTTISKVVKNQGQQGEEVLYQAPEKPEGEQVIDPEIAHEATKIMIGDVTEGIADDASLGAQPVAGKTGTSENFFDAWFIGYTPQLLTGLWMGYADGGKTLEYDLEYSRELNGLSGGITPAMIWKTYTERVLGGETIEQFDGVDMPEEERTSSDTESPDAAGQDAPRPGLEDAPNPGQPMQRNVNVSPSGIKPAGVRPTGVRPAGVRPAGVGATSVGPATAAPSSVSPSSARPSRNAATRALR